MTTMTKGNHADHAAEFIADSERTGWHDQALWFIRAKRDKAAQSVPEWERLREMASQIKLHTLARLPDYLEQFEEQATRKGAHVHWARDAQEHNRIVLQILQDYGAKKIVKSKSMLTEECHLNPFLERSGIEVIDTDLGERIVQLLDEPPSHIVLPAIHIRKEEVGELFHRVLGTEEGATDPKYLAEAARAHLRDKFMKADAGITGVNFAVAETGGFVVCTNEGNADLGISLPNLHIACMGIEKLIPRAQDLAVFPAAAVPFGHRPADHDVHVAFPRADSGRPAAHRAGGQRPQPHPAEPAVSRIAEMHPLRRLHEHLPGLPAQRRATATTTRFPVRSAPSWGRCRIPSTTTACPTRAACADRVPRSAPSRSRWLSNC